MQFLFPGFLLAMAALAIPIIIHLFYFRRFKKVYFTNVRFLKELKEETSARSRLRNLLVLAMRLLALALLVLAFVQPFIPQRDVAQQGKKNVSIFIDNSFSMTAASEDVPLIEKARQRAREVVDAYGTEDRFQILTNDFEGRHQRLVSQEDALALIDEIRVSPVVKELSTVLARQRQALRSETAAQDIAYIISDFQQNITEPAAMRDSLVQLNLVPLQAVRERNIGIDSAWFEAPVPMLNETNRLLVRVRNFSDEDAENVRLSIRYDGQTKPVGTLAVAARSYSIDTVNITILRTGQHEATLEITDYPIQFDDKYYFTFKVAAEINALVINEDTPNRFLEAAFRGLQYFNLNTASSRSLDYSRFAQYQLIVANELTAISSGLAAELQQYVRNGGNVLVFPSRNAELASYRSFLTGFPANELRSFEAMERVVGNVNTEEFVFNSVFENRSANLKLPVTQGNFGFAQSGSRKEEALLTYRDGSRFLSKFQIERGNLYVCAAPLREEYSNLVRSGEIFIPMLYKMAISAGTAKPIAYTIGRDEVLSADHQPATGEITYKLKGVGEEFIPAQRIAGNKVSLTPGTQIQDAGFYNLYLRPDSLLNQFAFNYDRKESALDCYGPAALREGMGEFANVIEAADGAVITAKVRDQSQGTPLWRWCLVLALLFLAVEALLLRFWKT